MSFQITWVLFQLHTEVLKENKPLKVYKKKSCSVFNAGRERGACDPADSTERHVIISRDEITFKYPTSNTRTNQMF